MKYCLLLFALLVTRLLQAQPYLPNWESLDTRPVPNWFSDAKFGIFIHWGVYAVPGFTTKGGYAEWYQQGLETGDSAKKEYHRKNNHNTSSAEVSFACILLLR